MGAAIAAALIGVAGTVGTTMYTQSQQKKAAAGQQAAMQAAGGLGEVPQAAMYEPIDFEQMQNAQILDNFYSLGNNKALVNATNKFITKDALRRAESLIPGYSQSMRTMGTNVSDLLNGRLPFEDMLDVVNDRASMTGATGIAGTGGGATLKDLGLSRMGAMQTGTGMLGDMVKMAEAISPRSSYMNPREMMMSPLDRIKLEMEQGVLTQQSEQNFYNLKAGVSGSDMARAQLGIGAGLNAGTSGGGMDPATIAALSSAASSLVGTVGKTGERQGWWGTPTQTPGGGYYSEQAMYRANPTAYDSVNVPGRGWQPMTQAEYYGDWAA